MAPEIHALLENSEQTYDATKADIFALGVILFALAFGKLPFEYASRQNKIFQELAHFQYAKFWINHQKECENLEMKDHSMLEDLKELLHGMLAADPAKRISIKEVL